jgi:hypothetical protein
MSARRALITSTMVLMLAGCGTPSSPGAAPVASQAPPTTEAAADAVAGLNSVAPSGSAKAAPPKGLDDRKKAAETLIARKPGKLGIVIRDRVSGTVWRAGATGEATWTASTIKLAIAADLLDRHRAGTIALDATDRTNMRSALVNSSNDAATALWNKYDGPAMLDGFRTKYGMKSLSIVPGYDAFWRNLRCTAEDLQALMSYVLDRMHADDRGYLVSTLRGVASNQRWGVWAAGASLKPGNKDGWAQKPDDGGTHWVTHSVGFAGEGERYVVAVTYRLTPSGSLDDGVRAVSDLVATYFGAPVPAKVTSP